MQTTGILAATMERRRLRFGTEEEDIRAVVGALLKEGVSSLREYSSMAGIWVFAENREQTLELLNAGKDLAADFGTKLAAFAWDRQLAQEYITYGADEVLALAAAG